MIIKQTERNGVKYITEVLDQKETINEYGVKIIKRLIKDYKLIGENREYDAIYYEDTTHYFTDGTKSMTTTGKWYKRLQALKDAYNWE